MALIKCTECGQMMSDKATKCPNCGCPIEATIVTPFNNMNPQPMNPQPMNPQMMNPQPMNPQIMNQQPMDQQPVYYQNGNSGNNNTWLYIIIAVLFTIIAGIAALFIFVGDDDPQDTPENTQTETTQGTTTVAPQFYGQVSDPDGYTNIRREPSTSAPIVKKYNSGDYLYYTPQGNGWSMVYSGNKANTFMGYMHTSRIVKVDPNKGSKQTNTSNTYLIGCVIDPVDSYVNVRTGPGTDYPIATQLDDLTEVYYIKSSSKWYKVYDTNYNYLGYVYYDRIHDF